MHTRCATEPRVTRQVCSSPSSGASNSTDFDLCHGSTNDLIAPCANRLRQNALAVRGAQVVRACARLLWQVVWARSMRAPSGARGGHDAPPRHTSVVSILAAVIDEIQVSLYV